MSKPTASFPTADLPAYQEIQQDLDTNGSFTQQAVVAINANYAASGAINITAAATPFSGWPSYGYVQNLTTGEIMFYNNITGGNTLVVPAAGRARQGTSASGGTSGQNVNLLDARILGTMINRMNAEIAALELIRTQVDFNSTPQTLTAAQSWQTFTNIGAAAEVTINLPVAAKGLRFKFLVDNANGIKVVTNGTDVINEGDVGGAAGTNAECVQANGFLELYSSKAGVWIIIGKSGAWAIT